MATAQETTDRDMARRLQLARQTAHVADAPQERRVPSFARDGVRPLTPKSIPSGQQQSQRRQLEYLRRAPAQRQRWHLPQSSRRINKVKIKRAHKAIRDYQKAPFILVYALAIANLFIGLLSLVAVGVFALLDVATTILLVIPFVGSAIKIAADTASFAIQGGIIFFQLLLSVYIFYFYWHYTSFLRRKIGKRVLRYMILFLQFIPIINLIPWQLVQLWLLQQTMKKRAERARKYLRKHNA